MQSWRACAHGQGVGETSQATATGCRGRWRTVARRRGTATGEITLRALVWHAKKLNRMLGKNKRGCDHRGMVRPKRRRPWPAGRPAATACRDNNTGARARGKKKGWRPSYPAEKLRPRRWTAGAERWRSSLATANSGGAPADRD
jgi:hypothetical protein